MTNKEDDSALKEAISKFVSNRERKNFLNMLKVFRETMVWIPGKPVWKEFDAEKNREMLEDSKERGESAIEDFVWDSVSMVPDILECDDGHKILAIFSKEENMGFNYQNVHKMRRSMTEAVNIARKEGVDSIILNIMTDPFLLEKDVFDIYVEAMDKLDFYLDEE